MNSMETDMNTDPKKLVGMNQSKRSIFAALLAIAFFGIAAALIVEGTLRAITVLIAVAAVVGVFLGLPGALVEFAARRRGTTYFKIISYVVPISTLLVLSYLGWIFWQLRSTELFSGKPVELALGFIIAAATLNLGTIIYNLFASE